MSAICCLNSNPSAKNPREDTKIEMVAVLRTFAFDDSLLKKRKKAVSIPYARMTLNSTK
jgi:hypothetical protein